MKKIFIIKIIEDKTISYVYKSDTDELIFEEINKATEFELEELAIGYVTHILSIRNDCKFQIIPLFINE